MPASSTSSTTTTSTTGTTAPPAVEICGNCIDDDGNGLADIDDPACCADATIAPLDVRALRFRGRRDGPALTMLVALDDIGSAPLAPSTRTFALQVGPADGPPLVCARIEAARLRPTRRRLRFTDRRDAVPEAGGLDRLRLRLRRDGRITLKAIGRRLGIVLPGPGEFRVAVGSLDASVPGAQMRCRGSVERLEPIRGGVGLR